MGYGSWGYGKGAYNPTRLGGVRVTVTKVEVERKDPLVREMLKMTRSRCL